MTTQVFVCVNQRPNAPSCGQRSGMPMLADRLSQQVEHHECKGEVEVFRTRCLGRCPDGPVLTILPDNVSYRYDDESDLDDIVSEHLVGGRPVGRLMLSKRDGQGRVPREPRPVEGSDGRQAA